MLFAVLYFKDNLFFITISQFAQKVKCVDKRKIAR